MYHILCAATTQNKIPGYDFLSETIHKFSLKQPCLFLYFVEVLCVTVGCSNKSGRHKVSFFRVPTVVNNQGMQGEFMEKITAERRRKWISAISREGLTDKILEIDRVCEERFVSGKPAASRDKHSFDWVPAVKLGHSKVLVLHLLSHKIWSYLSVKLNPVKIRMIFLTYRLT